MRCSDYVNLFLTTPDGWIELIATVINLYLFKQTICVLLLVKSPGLSICPLTRMECKQSKFSIHVCI